jgi:DNA-directed RNA polymerase subunit RPC12/RpoP
MAAWVLGCLNCKDEFPHAKIDGESLANFLQPMKPIFPHQGLEVACPLCGHKGLYRRHELVYRA